MQVDSNARWNRIKARVPALLLLGSISLVLAIGCAWKQFHDAEAAFRRMFPFRQLISYRVKKGMPPIGVVTLPISPEEFGTIKSGKACAEAANDLPPGDYHYLVFEDLGAKKFVVVDGELSITTSGTLNDVLLP